MAATTITFLALSSATTAPPPATPGAPPSVASTTTEATREQWMVEFSQFFNYPPRTTPSDSDATALTGLRPVAKRRTLLKGTWLRAASPAALVILKPTAYSVPILSVSVLGLVHEEHFISDLHFSWPQVSCSAQCPIRGSRVVFLSYSDSSAQIQKFAVRFLTSGDAEAFLNFVKECSKDTMDVAPPESDVMCGNSSLHEFVSSNEHHYRNCDRGIGDESSYVEPITTYTPELPALIFNDEQSDCPDKRVLAKKTDSIFSGLPPSFTELLNNYSTDTEKGQLKPVRKGDLASPNRGNLSSRSFNDSSTQTNSIQGADLRSLIVKYMADASFHDIYAELEKVVYELGGDLALQ